MQTFYDAHNVNEPDTSFIAMNTARFQFHEFRLELEFVRNVKCVILPFYICVAYVFDIVILDSSVYDIYLMNSFPPSRDNCGENVSSL